MASPWLRTEIIWKQLRYDRVSLLLWKALRKSQGAPHSDTLLCHPQVTENVKKQQEKPPSPSTCCCRCSRCTGAQQKTLFSPGESSCVPLGSLPTAVPTGAPGFLLWSPPNTIVQKVVLEPHGLFVGSFFGLFACLFSFSPPPTCLLQIDFFRRKGNGDYKAV